MMTRPLPTGNRYLTCEIDALPGYVDALKLVELADAKLRSLPAPEPVPARLDPFATGNITDEWVTAQIDRVDAQAEQARRRAVISELRRDAHSAAAAIIGAHRDAILTRLNDQLAQLLAEVSELVDQLDGASTASQAVVNSAGDAWKRLIELADDYDELRDAQLILMQQTAAEYRRMAQPSAGGEPHASDLYISNLDDIWPSWQSPGGGDERVIHIDGHAHRYEPWPADPVELLLWLATSNARPWIPVVSQLDDLGEQRRQRANPNPKRIGTSTMLNRTTTTIRTKESADA